MTYKYCQFYGLTFSKKLNENKNAFGRLKKKKNFYFYFTDIKTWILS